MIISRHFTEAESIITSHRNLDNTPSAEIRKVIIGAAHRLDFVRDALESPVIVSSWYRSPAVNKAVGSKAKYSQHMKGEAIDFICPRYGSPLDVVRFLAVRMKELMIDQLILEHSWTHISFAINSPTETRGQVLTLLADGTYALGITDLRGNKV